jgi:DNA polymerase III delta prime subunit|uniref:AAA+ ATPase domain-containing protein n=1 Tax=viral metagenome TaxID=1070528 RepID=A0A6C0IMD7_9ZZZZ
MNSENIPFVEKYRPKILEDTVLDNLSRTILENMITMNDFPNLFFYGPPGTGKTTTIINLIESFQKKYNGSINKSLVIHLNASDERGIDTIRTQINNFVLSKSLFKKGTKFVILDEVDYMTKNAQQALKYLLENNNNDNIRFCLICNYISKIDSGLQNEFIKIRFNDLPKEKIIGKLKYISEKEELNLSLETLEKVQKLYKSDMRSMINFIQLCVQSNLKLEDEINIINDKICEDIEEKIIGDQMIVEKYLYDISLINNIEKNNLIKIIFNYIINNKREKITPKFLKYMENIIHCLPSLNDKDIITRILNDLKGYII